jgi:hypothetical protein
MTDLELIFTMLGENSTKEIAQIQDIQGFEPTKYAARFAYIKLSILRELG